MHLCKEGSRQSVGIIELFGWSRLQCNTFIYRKKNAVKWNSCIKFCNFPTGFPINSCCVKIPIVRYTLVHLYVVLAVVMIGLFLAAEGAVQKKITCSFNSLIFLLRSLHGLKCTSLTTGYGMLCCIFVLNTNLPKMMLYSAKRWQGKTLAN